MRSHQAQALKTKQHPLRAAKAASHHGAGVADVSTSVDFALVNRFSTQDAAAYLGIRGETLARWRSERRTLGVEQPNFYRIGKKIFYLKNDLDAFLLERGEASLACSRT